ncbi:MAG: hypothetical protein FWD57_12790 [Polyangiaceae bacterium]|nr:hypothetical protein [Polyangiaceae bacterium]
MMASLLLVDVVCWVCDGGSMCDGASDSYPQAARLSTHAGSLYPLRRSDFWEKTPLVRKPLFTCEMLGCRSLDTDSLCSCFAPMEAILRRYLGADEEVFAIIVETVDDGTGERLHRGPVCQSGFKRHN